MEAEQQPFRQGKRRWLGILAVLALVVLIIALLLPWSASACFVERAGRRLASGELSQTSSEAAARDLQQALRWDPANAQAYRFLAGLYWKQGLPVRAAEAWARFVGLRPDDPQGYWELAVVCEALDPSELSQVAGQTCGTDAQSRSKTLAELWRAAGQTAGSFIRAGDELYQAKDWAQATAHYQRAILTDPDMVMAWLGLGRVHLARNELGQAEEAFSRVIDLAADPALLAPAHDYRGQILARTGRWEAASDELALAVALAPDNGSYHLRYGWYAVQAGRPVEESRTHFEQARQLLPGDPWPELRLSDVAFQVEDYEAMLAHAQQAIQKDGSQVWGWILQGRALRHLGQLDGAEESLRRAVELAPKEPATHEELGQILMGAGRAEEALGEYRQAIALAPRDSRYHLSLGSAYLSLGQTADAVSIYRQILEFEPSNPEAQEALRGLGY